MSERQIVYVVEMNRWGDTENHHYLGGVFENLIEALEEGYQHGKWWRANKYEPLIYMVEVYKKGDEAHPRGTHNIICRNSDEARHLLEQLSPESLKEKTDDVSDNKDG